MTTMEDLMQAALAATPEHPPSPIGYGEAVRVLGGMR